MALALYRKYRPATFADVVGQEHVTEPLRKALAAGRINHAYLFSGPRGCGKTSSARILARSLNCENGPTPDPCGVCASCVALAPEGPGSLDVVELDAASHGGVEDTRELRDRAFYMPAESRYRVFIIDEAHMVSSQGFNALLKIVEEPPEHLVFVFATTEPEKVLPTIRSRTHHYPFHLLPPAVLRGLLEKLCGEEGVAVEPAVFPLVVKAGAGSARDSLSVMDQLLAGAGPEGVTYTSAVALLGVTDGALLDEMVDALTAGDGAAVYGAIERVAQAGHDPRRFGADLLQRFRDLVILKAVPDAVDKGLIDEPADQLAAMAAQAERLAPATLTRFAEVVHEGLSDMRGTTSPRLVLELLAARMLLPSATLDDAGLLQRLERVERRLDIADESAGSRVRTSTVPVSDSPSAPSAPQISAAAPPAPPGPAGSAAPPAPPASAPSRSKPQATTAERPAAAAPASGSGNLGLPEPPVLSTATTAAKPRQETAAEAAKSDAAQTPPAGDVTPRADSTSRAESTPSAEPSPRAGAVSPTAERHRPGEGADVGVADVRRLWPEVLEMIKGRNRRAHALLESAAVTIVRVDGGVLSLSTQFPALARMISEVRNGELVTEALRELLGVDWRVRCEESGADSLAGRTEVSGADATNSLSSAAGQRAAAPASSPPRTPAPTPSSDSTAHGTPRTTPPAVARDGQARSSGPAPREPHRRPPSEQAAASDEEPARGAPSHTAVGGELGAGAASSNDAPAEENPYNEIDPDDDAAHSSSYQVIDPSKVAIELLERKLGARPIDGPL